MGEGRETKGEGWKDGRGLEEVGLVERGQGPSHVQIAQVPSQRAHLDPAVLSGHLVHLPAGRGAGGGAARGGLP